MHRELSYVALFVLCLLKVCCYTGMILVPVVFWIHHQIAGD